LEALFARGAQVLRAAVGPPLARTVAQQPALGRDHEVFGIWAQRLRDEALAHERSVRVGGVDQVDAELDRASQHRDRLVVVRRFTPDARTGDAHRAEPESVHGKVAAEAEWAAPVRARISHEVPSRRGGATLCPVGRP
jgi:hypothetical protein